MTLSDVADKFFSLPHSKEPSIIYIFEDEDSAENFILQRQGSNLHDYNFIGIFKSDMKLSYTFREEWCEAEINQFYALNADTLVVVCNIDRDTLKKI